MFYKLLASLIFSCLIFIIPKVVYANQAIQCTPDIKGDYVSTVTGLAGGAILCPSDTCFERPGSAQYECYKITNNPPPPPPAGVYPQNLTINPVNIDKYAGGNSISVSVNLGPNLDSDYVIRVQKQNGPGSSYVLVCSSNSCTSVSKQVSNLNMGIGSISSISTAGSTQLSFNITGLNNVDVDAGVYIITIEKTQGSPHLESKSFTINSYPNCNTSIDITSLTSCNNSYDLSQKATLCGLNNSGYVCLNDNEKLCMNGEKKSENVTCQKPKTQAAVGTGTTGTPGPTGKGTGQSCNTKNGHSVEEKKESNGTVNYYDKVTGNKISSENLGIDTAIGCIPTDFNKMVEAISKLAIGVGGGIALLLMIAGAFRMITSAGNPDAVKAGHEQFTSAIIGLLFIIFAVLLLKVIGVDILNIPGFS